MTMHDILVIHLLDQDTIKIRTLEMKTCDGDYSNTFFDTNPNIDTEDIQFSLPDSKTLVFDDEYCKLCR